MNACRPSSAGAASELARRLAVVLVVISTLGCNRGTKLEGATVTVGCGRCIFEMEGLKGCPWAVELEGKAYLVQGPLPDDHSTHAPDGICNMRRQAIVDGQLKGDRFVATRFELLPARDVPANPRFKTDAH